jgi:hypothetical protein
MHIPIELVRYIYEYSTDIDMRIHLGFINKINMEKYKFLEKIKKKPLKNYSKYNYEIFYR